MSNMTRMFVKSSMVLGLGLVFGTPAMAGKGEAVDHEWNKATIAAQISARLLVENNSQRVDSKNVEELSEMLTAYLTHLKLDPTDAVEIANVSVSSTLTPGKSFRINLAEQKFKGVPLHEATGSFLVDLTKKEIRHVIATRYRLPKAIPNTTSKVSEIQVREMIVGQPTSGTVAGPLTKEEAGKAEVKLVLLTDKEVLDNSATAGRRPMGEKGKVNIYEEATFRLVWFANISPKYLSERWDTSRVASYRIDALTGKFIPIPLKTLFQ